MEPLPASSRAACSGCRGTCCGRSGGGQVIRRSTAPTSSAPRHPPPKVRLDEDLLCWRCRYNLRGVPDGRCPECGEPFDRAYLLSRAIPWERRAQLGRVWAYLETVVVVSFRPARFAAGVREEREPRHGLRFRMVTTLLVFAFACTLLALVRRQFMVLYWPKPVW